jgi:chemotaxis protein methyltransferase CheR
MLFSEHLGYFGFSNIVIHATDHEESEFPQFRESIALGVFPEMVLKTTPRPDLIRKYSRPAARPGYIQVVEEIRNKVVFQRHDLLSFQEVGTDFSLVVCKNVLLHFQPPQQSEVVRMFHRALVPDGFLALDQAHRPPPGTEHLWTNIAEGGFLYRKVGGL